MVTDGFSFRRTTSSGNKCELREGSLTVGEVGGLGGDRNLRTDKRLESEFCVVAEA
jgi:hypothetical protein